MKKLLVIFINFWAVFRLTAEIPVQQLYVYNLGSKIVIFNESAFKGIRPGYKSQTAFETGIKVMVKNNNTVFPRTQIPVISPEAAHKELAEFIDKDKSSIRAIKLEVHNLVDNSPSRNFVACHVPEGHKLREADGVGDDNDGLCFDMSDEEDENFSAVVSSCLQKFSEAQDGYEIFVAHEFMDDIFKLISDFLMNFSLILSEQMKEYQTATTVVDNLGAVIADLLISGTRLSRDDRDKYVEIVKNMQSGIGMLNEHLNMVQQMREILNVFIQFYSDLTDLGLSGDVKKLYEASDKGLSEAKKIIEFLMSLKSKIEKLNEDVVQLKQLATD